MDPGIVYTKTSKGLDEIRWRRHKLPARLRALLITIDGKSTAAALVRRFSSPAQAATGIAGLLACGFIEVAATAAGDSSADPIVSARQFMRNSLLAAMGSDADYFSASLDAARSLEDIAELASEFLDVVRAGGDGNAANAFIAGLRNFGIVQDAGRLSPDESPAPKGGA
ncbi:MAG: hypothetical protein AW10_02191 [Candidatus Accumulibacter appositus]|uniref:Uncharacterized protein n=1 Tax=Candidatus Accumulibacter appositus TaxID=1454003 RepID=A0A011PSC6_9PROT|nr:hypothetical protein [Accumulibacter sp.]EXI79892.1 MAG: hypothetical protein AW10_02191 [Candidatus Accumulibacter appositus]HRF05456.1 hypothetical protein [Accumulibacter sp.]